MVECAVLDLLGEELFYFRQGGWKESAEFLVVVVLVVAVAAVVVLVVAVAAVVGIVVAVAAVVVLVVAVAAVVLVVVVVREGYCHHHYYHHLRSSGSSNSGGGGTPPPPSAPVDPPSCPSLCPTPTRCQGSRDQCRASPPGPRGVVWC